MFLHHFQVIDEFILLWLFLMLKLHFLVFTKIFL